MGKPFEMGAHLRPLLYRCWMRPCLALVAALLCLQAYAGNPVATPPYLGERLAYRVSYQGGLSGQSAVDIADAVLETGPAAENLNGIPAYYSALQVSTAEYPAMEELYPFRYRFVSYYSTDLSRTHYVEVSKTTRRDQREIVRFDWEGGKAERYKRRGKPPQDRPAVTALLDGAEARRQGYRHNARDDLQLDGSLLDRLSLLQAVRAGELFAGRTIELPVSDGRAIYRYRVRVLGRERLEQDGQSWDTYKLSFDGFERQAAPGQPEHAPVFVWMTADNRRLPVRFSSEALLGVFNIDLRTINEQPALAAAGERLAITP